VTPDRSIAELVYRSCMLLDERRFADYLALCDPAFHYAITAYSNEIRKEMTWLEHDKIGLKQLFDTLPKHNSDHSPLTRHASVYTIDMDGEAGHARVVTALQVFKTSLDGGATELFAVGKLYDKVKLGGEGEAPMLLDRNVRLDTRLLGFGFHIPF